MHEIENDPDIRTREQLMAEASAEGAVSSAVLMGSEVLCETVRAKLLESDESSDDDSRSRPNSKLSKREAAGRDESSNTSSFRRIEIKGQSKSDCAREGLRCFEFSFSSYILNT